MRSMPTRHLQPRRSSTQKSIISRPNRRSVFFLPAYCATWPCRRYSNSPWENFCCAACWRRRIRWRCRGKSPPAGAAINYLPSPAKAFKPPPGTVLGVPAHEAEAFQRAFQTVAEKRHRMRLRRGAGKDDETLFADTRDRGGFALARHDNIVVYLTSSPDRLAATAEAAWQDLEVDTAPEGLRFDSARGPAQLSLSKRKRPASFLTLPSRSSFSRCACTENSATRLSAAETST